jgi:hypothetical protein
MCSPMQVCATQSDDIQHFMGINSGYVEIKLKIKRGISIGWTNYSIPAASTIYH